MKEAALRLIATGAAPLRVTARAPHGREMLAGARDPGHDSDFRHECRRMSGALFSANPSATGGWCPGSSRCRPEWMGRDDPGGDADGRLHADSTTFFEDMDDAGAPVQRVLRCKSVCGPAAPDFAGIVLRRDMSGAPAPPPEDRPPRDGRRSPPCALGPRVLGLSLADGAG